MKKKKGLNTSKPYDKFRSNVFGFKSNIRQLLDKMHNENGLIVGYGASTKGTVLRLNLLEFYYLKRI